MDVTKLPFNQLIGLKKSVESDYLLTLDNRIEYRNHLDTVHASAQFALAEATSGHFLLNEFSELTDIFPVVMGNGMIDQNTAFQLGKMSGARYVVQITLQKPDVEKVENNAQVGTLLGGVAGAMANSSNNRQIQQTQRQLQQTATYTPDVRSANIKVKVKIYTKVVDLQTSRVLFQCSGEGNAKGKPQIQLEYMQLGAANISLNQNADFTHSVTGKAVEEAFKKIGKELRQYFEKKL